MLEALPLTMLESGSASFLSFFYVQFFHHISTSIIIKQFCFYSSSIVLVHGYFIIISFTLMYRLFHIHMFKLISFMSGKALEAYIKWNIEWHWEKTLRTIILILWPRDIIQHFRSRSDDGSKRRTLHRSIKSNLVLQKF